MLGSIGGQEFLLIAVLALLLFGPRKLPQIGRSMGKALAEFRGATQELKSSLEREVRMEEVREVKDGLVSAGREIVDGMKPVSRSVAAKGEGDSTLPEAEPPDGEKPPQS